MNKELQSADTQTSREHADLEPRLKHKSQENRRHRGAETKHWVPHMHLGPTIMTQKGPRIM